MGTTSMVAAGLVFSPAATVIFGKLFNQTLPVL